MIKETLLHLIITAVIFLLALLLHLLPETFSRYLAVFCVLTAGCLALSVWCNEAYAIFTALLVPAAAWFILSEGDRSLNTMIPYIRESLSALSASLVCGIIYLRFRVIIRAYFAGTLMSLMIPALTGFGFSLLQKRTYTLPDFYQEQILSCWPGLVICLVLLPLITFIFRQVGLMVFLRNED